MDSTVADPLIGRVLDSRYHVGPRIARGGMATVYEAVDLRLDRVCAVKVMHAGLGEDHDFADRFVREARAAARLSHPHVVNVFDQGDDEGTLFLAMEHVPGQTLRDVIREQAPMPPGRALRLLEPILSALSAAHAAGLIHRDVKPENVLIADDGRVKVADFGLARAISADTQHTATGGILIGTVSYLAPELVVNGRADARCDVYAAGVLLYEMLTGRKPHEGESPIQVAYKHVNEDVPAPSAVTPGIPAYVDALVARATARDRGLRPADARVLLHQVRRVRGALDHGVLDDPELTADLSPTVRVLRGEDIDYVIEDVPQIQDTTEAAGAEDRATPAELKGLGGPAAGPGGAAGPRHDTSVIGRRTGGSAAAAPSRPGRAPRPRRSRTGPLLLLLVLLLAIGGGAGGWWFGSGRYTTTPGLIGLTARQARVTLGEAGLAFATGPSTYSETVDAGEVLRTDPAGGERLIDGETVTVTLSLGPERYQVPVVRGRAEERAAAVLAAQSLSVGDTARRFHERVPAGVVVASSPGAGKALKPGAAVDLVVSRGPRPVDVPDLTGRDADRAQNRLTRLGFQVQTTSENSDSVPEGDVVTQTPSDGTLFHGDTVTVTVSEGPVLVEVPGLAAVGVEDATARLKELGFRVRTREGDTYLGLGYVSSTDPGSGVMAPEGSVITLFLV